MNRPVNPNIRYPKNELPVFQPTSHYLIDCALREFSREELQQMPKPMVHSIVSLIRKAMLQSGPNIAQAELKGIRDL